MEDKDIDKMVFDFEIPLWYELQSYSEIPTKSELPVFCLIKNAKDIKELTKESLQEPQMRVFVRNDHTTTGLVEVDFFQYLMNRAKAEMNPNFLTNYHYLLYSAIKVIRDHYNRTPLALYLLYKWMLKYGHDGKQYVNPVRLSGTSIQSFGTDSYFLKRISIVLNACVLYISFSHYCSYMPEYLDVIDEVSTYLFYNPIANIRSFKKLHSAISLNFGLLPLGHELLSGLSELGRDMFIHAHPVYPDFEPRKSRLDTRVPFSASHTCYNCAENRLIKGVIAEHFLPKVRKALKDLAFLPATARLSRVLLADTYSIGTVHTISAFAMLMSLTGFTETNKVLDTVNAIEESNEISASQDVKSSDQVRLRYHNTIRDFYRHITKYCVAKGKYMDGKKFRQSILSMVTGKSAGMGTYTFKLTNKVLDGIDMPVMNTGRQQDEIRLTFTDKRFIALLQGDQLLNFQSRELQTMSFKDWLASKKLTSPIEYVRIMENEKSNKRENYLAWKYGKPLVQRSIGVRSVPGGRAIRAIYVQPLPIYILETLCFTYIDAFSDILRSNTVASKWPNEFDLGNTNLKIYIDATDDSMAPLIMATSTNTNGLFYIDYSSFDQSQTYTGAIKHKFESMNEVLSALPPDHYIRDVYANVDGTPTDLIGLLHYLQRFSTINLFYIRDGPVLSEVPVKHLTSGGKDTFDENTTDNGAAIHTLEYELSMQTRLSDFEHVRIAGDDCAGICNLENATQDEIKTFLRLITEVPTRCGFRVNVDKSGCLLGGFEMAKIAGYRGFSIRIGAIQLLESEKETQADNLTSQLRGSAAKFFTFMERFPSKLSLFRKFQSYVLSGAYILDITGKRGVEGERSRTTFIPDVIVQYGSTSSEGGLGVSIGGSSMNDIVYMYQKLGMRPMALQANWLASRISYRKSEMAKKQVAARLMRLRREEEVRQLIDIRNPQGATIAGAFTRMESALRVSDSDVSASRDAYNVLTRNKVNIAKNLPYFNVINTMVNESLLSALHKLDSSILVHNEFVSEIKKTGYSTDAGCRRMTSDYPLLGIATFTKGEPLAVQTVTPRYASCCDALFKAYKYIGLRYGTFAPRGRMALEAYAHILRSARRHGTSNPLMTEESLRDVITDALSSAKHQMHVNEVVSRTITALFGTLPDIDMLAQRVVNHVWEFSSTSLGYTKSLGILAYCNDADINFVRLVGGSAKMHNHMVRNLALVYIANDIALFDSSNKVEIAAIGVENALIKQGIMQVTRTVPNQFMPAFEVQPEEHNMRISGRETAINIHYGDYTERT